MRVPPPRLRPGDELTTGWLNKIRDWCVRNTLQGVSAGLTAQQLDTGFTLGAIIPDGASGSVGVVQTGGISARVGSTYGSGNVLVNTLGVNITVKNFSSTTGGIAAGTYVFVQQDSAGTWWVTSVDCGN